MSGVTGMLKTWMLLRVACAALWLLSGAARAEEPHKSLYAIERQIVTVHVRADGTYQERIELVTQLKSLAAIDTVSQDIFDFESDRQTLEVIEAFYRKPVRGTCPGSG